jgi:hypothetical protein
MPLSYAVGLPEGQSALAATLLQNLSAGGTITIEQLASYIKVELPK